MGNTVNTAMTSEKGGGDAAARRGTTKRRHTGGIFARNGKTRGQNA